MRLVCVTDIHIYASALRTHAYGDVNVIEKTVGVVVVIAFHRRFPSE